jgi:hypothetical protein
MLNVRICVGTYCYITGGSELVKVKDYLPEEIKEKVTFIGSACLGCDKSSDTAKPPYAKVGNKMLVACTEEMLIDEIYSQLGIARKDK